MYGLESPSIDRLEAALRLELERRADVSFAFSTVALVVRGEGRVADLIERPAREYLDVAPLSRRAIIEAYAA